MKIKGRVSLQQTRTLKRHGDQMQYNIMNEIMKQKKIHEWKNW